jgi:hypothetical protein
MLMKDMIRQMVQFTLVYGTRDRDRFYSFADEWLDSYQLDEKTKGEIINFAYEFMSQLGDRMSQKSVIADGIKNGVESLEDKLSELNRKLEDIRRKLPETQ